MTVEKVVCDECGRVRGEANHWHRLGVMVSIDGKYSLELGELIGDVPEGWGYSVHDLCGEQCFYRHIGKLLKIELLGVSAA